MIDSPLFPRPDQGPGDRPAARPATSSAKKLVAPAYEFFGPFTLGPAPNPAEGIFTVQDVPHGDARAALVLCDNVPFCGAIFGADGDLVTSGLAGIGQIGFMFRLPNSPWQLTKLVNTTNATSIRMSLLVSSDPGAFFFWS